MCAVWWGEAIVLEHGRVGEMLCASLGLLESRGAKDPQVLATAFTPICYDNPLAAQREPTSEQLPTLLWRKGV
jgi:hypothetical protein